jgi:hypothetical protein
MKTYAPHIEQLMKIEGEKHGAWVKRSASSIIPVSSEKKTI